MIVMGRTACSVLESMREANKTRNYSYLEAAIEELQFICNRMEAALGDAKEVKELRAYRSQVKDELKALYSKYVEKCKELGETPKEVRAYLGFDLEEKPRQFFTKKENDDDQLSLFSKE